MPNVDCSKQPWNALQQRKQPVHYWEGQLVHMHSEQGLEYGRSGADWKEMEWRWVDQAQKGDGLSSNCQITVAGVCLRSRDKDAFILRRSQPASQLGSGKVCIDPLGQIRPGKMVRIWRALLLLISPLPRAWTTLLLSCCCPTLAIS